MSLLILLRPKTSGGPPPAQAGVRSMLAFWMGGAGSPAAAPTGGFIPIVGRGPGLQLAGGKGLAG